MFFTAREANCAVARGEPVLPTDNALQSRGIVGEQAPFTKC